MGNGPGRLFCVCSQDQFSGINYDEIIKITIKINDNNK